MPVILSGAFATPPRPSASQVGFIAFFWGIMLTAQKTLNFNKR